MTKRSRSCSRSRLRPWTAQYWRCARCAAATRSRGRCRLLRSPVVATDGKATPRRCSNAPSCGLAPMRHSILDRGWSMPDELFLDAVKTPIGDLLLSRMRAACCALGSRQAGTLASFSAATSRTAFRRSATRVACRQLKRCFAGDIARWTRSCRCARHRFPARLLEEPAGYPPEPRPAMARSPERWASPAMRAVSLANGANPIAVVALSSRRRCRWFAHRLRRGLERKRWLLDHEARHAARKGKTI